MGRAIDSHQQTCKVCGQPEKFDFEVPDDLWRRVVPVPFRSVVVCLYCFDEFAREAGVRYASDVRAVYFAGAMGSMVFSVQSATDAC